MAESLWTTTSQNYRLETWALAADNPKVLDGPKMAKADGMKNVTGIDSTSTDVLTRARSVLDKLQEAAPRIEANSGLTNDVVDAMHAARLFRTTMPGFLGGDTVDLQTHAQLI